MSVECRSRDPVLLLTSGEKSQTRWVSTEEFNPFGQYSAILSAIVQQDKIRIWERKKLNKSGPCSKQQLQKLKTAAPLSPLPGGLVVRIRRSHRRGPGSIPGQGTLFCRIGKQSDGWKTSSYAM